MVLENRSKKMPIFLKPTLELSIRSDQISCSVVSDSLRPQESQHTRPPCPFRMRWPKYWTFSFSIIPSKEIPELISFRMDWLDLLAVQGTLKSLLQYQPIKTRETNTKTKSSSLNNSIVKSYHLLCCCSVAKSCPALCKPPAHIHTHAHTHTHGLQHTRLPGPSLYPRVCSNSCSLIR